jgi:hypothetical protein
MDPITVLAGNAGVREGKLPPLRCAGRIVDDNEVVWRQTELGHGPGQL